MLVERILSLAQKRLVTMKDTELLTSAAKLLYCDGHINLIVVCNSGGAMAGVLTKTDIIRQISVCGKAASACTTPIGEVMTKDVIYCRPKDWLKDVWATMKDKQLLHVPIVSEDLKPLGVINARDALLALWEESNYEESLLRDYVMGIGYH